MIFFFPLLFLLSAWVLQEIFVPCAISTHIPTLPNLQPIFIFSFIHFRELLMQCRSVACCCQFNLDDVTSACVSLRGREKDREGELAELHSWTFNPLILLDYIHTFIRQLSIHVPLFITSVCFWALNLFPFTDERSSHLAVSCLCFLPHPCTLCTILISFPISGTSVRSYPYTFPITQPPARSFSRTACFQHPLADWPVGIKGTVPQRSAWLYSSSATMLSSFVLILRQHKSTHM